MLRAPDHRAGCHPPITGSNPLALRCARPPFIAFTQPARAPTPNPRSAAAGAAQALGGRVERNPRGFAAGWRRFRLSAAAQWALRWGGGEMRLRYSHGDVVARLPDGAAGVGCSAHCGVEGMIIGRHILTLQALPPPPRGVLCGAVEDRWGVGGSR